MLIAVAKIEGPVDLGMTIVNSLQETSVRLQLRRYAAVLVS